ncbi:target of Nesh-SH3 isoform X50 [Columba livia]|uniref:target of Nesh-SH3 isoform X50 n=1 Tax=Columba livia TaxID=8932 RepID=UPI0031B9AF4F
MMSRLVFLLFCGYIALNLGNAQKLPRVKRQSLKVQINATDDTVCMRYLRPSQNTKLEGFVLGYGSNFFSNQYVPLPSEGNTYVTELDAEPRYLVSVRPARISNNKKSCSGRNKTQKPLQLVVGTLTPTSVFLSWGILVNPQHDWTATNNCASDRFYTVRYREKDKDKKWVFQLCPVTETVVDNLKPNTVYEFGVKDNVEDSIWSKTSNHKIVLSNKKVNGHLQNMYKLVPNAQTQLTLRDNKKLVPVTIIKQVIQNRTQSKTADSSSLPGAILVHLIVPGLNETQQKLPPLLPIDDRPQASRKKLAKNESRVWPAESKTPEVQEISPQTLPAQAEKKYGPEEFKSTPKPELVRTQNNLASNEIQPLPSGSRISDAPKSLLTEFATWSPGLKLVSLPSTEATEMEMAFEETQPVSSGSKTSATTEVQPTRSASHDFLHVTSTPQTFTASEIPDTASDTTELKISTPIITTESQLSGTALDLGERKPLSSRSTTSGMPEMPPVSAASQKPDLESTSWTSPETTRPAMATRRPRLKSTTPSSLPTQQTVMASHDFLDVTSTPQTSTSAKISERETVIIQAPFKPASSNNIEEEPATDETPPVSSRPTMFPIPEMPSTKSATQRPGLKFTSHPSIETRGSVMDFLSAFDEKQDISLGSETPDIQEMPLTVPASQKPDLESTSWTSPETTRPAMATRRPRLKSTTPSSLPTQQTVMASLDSHHITVRFQTSASAEISKIETVTSSADLEKSVPSLSRTPHVLTTTTAFGGIQPVLSSPVTPSKPEIADAGRATSEPILESFTPKTSRAFQWPRVTLAPKEIPLIPSKLKPSASPEVQHVKPAPKPPLLEPKISQMLEQPKATLAPKEAKLTPSASKPRPSARPKKPRTKPAATIPVSVTTRSPYTFERPKPAEVLEPITLRIEQPRSTIAPKESQRVPSKPRTSPKPHIPQVKDVLESITRRTDQLKPTIVPKEIQRVPSKPRTPPISEVPQTKPVLEPITFGTEKPKSTAAPKDTHLVPSKPKTSPSPRVPPTRASPKESRRVPSKPRASPSPDVPHTKPVPNETYQISPKPKTALATEIPRFHTALSKTTLAPPRTKAPGLPKWIVPTADEVYTPEDIAREFGMDVKKPLEYSHTWEKPFAVTTSPGPRHPPVPPVKPTQMRRKPLPPNTVTGKPGSPAKPAGPTTPVRTGTSYKTPTAFATPEYYVDATVFSSSPTSETDSSGKPRYQAPHVKYMKKDDDVPCSITSSLEHFPQEEAGSKEEPTRPPQNPPTNLTVVTVEGCPTFVILDWEKPDNDTVTEYEVVSTENGASDGEKEKSITTTNQTHSTVENLKPDTSYEFHVKPRNPLGEGPSSNVVQFSTESADPRVSEPISMGKDAIWTEIPFDSDSYSECKGKQYVKRTWYKKFVGVQLCNSLRYKIYLSDSLTGKFYNIGDQRGHGEDHCQFVDSFLDGRTGQQEDLPVKDGFFRAVRQEPVKFGKIGGETQINYVRWYECGTSIPGKW